MKQTFNLTRFFASSYLTSMKGRPSCDALRYQNISWTTGWFYRTFLRVISGWASTTASAQQLKDPSKHKNSCSSSSFTAKTWSGCSWVIPRTHFEHEHIAWSQISPLSSYLVQKQQSLKSYFQQVWPTSARVWHQVKERAGPEVLGLTDLSPDKLRLDRYKGFLCSWNSILHFLQNTIITQITLTWSSVFICWVKCSKV